MIHLRLRNIVELLYLGYLHYYLCLLHIIAWFHNELKFLNFQLYWKNHLSLFGSLRLKVFIEGLEGHHEVRIYNALGMLVKTESIDGDSEINVSELTTGLYLIRIDNHSTRFVKD